MGLGVAALIAAVLLGPIGLAIAVIVLARRSYRSDTDRICAWVGVVIGSLWTLCCCPSILTSLLSGNGS
jgi:hypothetical protein